MNSIITLVRSHPLQFCVAALRISYEFQSKVKITFNCDLHICFHLLTQRFYRWESDNNVHGRSKNLYDTARTVGGSSGGEGCIQAAAGSAFGLGSDIGGSIRIPAFFNGVFGHKPSPFIVSNVGQFPSPTTKELQGYLGLGPMCRHAEDLAPLLKVLAGGKAEKLKLEETVDVKDINVFYQENDQGSLFVSSVNKEIRILFSEYIPTVIFIITWKIKCLIILLFLF